MPESVPLRCPACRRERLYTAPSYPCPCGTPVVPRLDPGAAPAAVEHRAWQEEWITVRCPSCGRRDQWPRPELGCACGAVLRIPVTDAAQGPATRTTEAGTEAEGAGTEAKGAGQPAGDTEPAAGAAETGAEAEETGAGAQEAGAGARESGAGAEETGAEAVETATEDAGTGTAGAGPRTAGAGPRADDAETARAGCGPVPDASRPARPPFRPIAIRTARDAVTATALYLRWLGHRDIRRADQRPASGVGLAARGLLAHVDPSVHPATLRDVECLWLTAMTDSADCVYFSLAGYTADARARADSLAVPLFVLDLTGTPQPVNAAAERLGTDDA
ncbi:hypothetical protein ACFYO5_12310 [Streptomyces sp. NPDC006259]|uniref:hypothetical protein n=1 Tax=Streptomyces sp. NPDC006259 TaxID=3364740 RepID=UPI003673CA44